MSRLRDGLESYSIGLEVISGNHRMISLIYDNYYASHMITISSKTNYVFVDNRLKRS
jgi:hypothetical protein